jgi:hypothetical protein
VVERTQTGAISQLACQTSEETACHIEERELDRIGQAAGLSAVAGERAARGTDEITWQHKVK